MNREPVNPDDPQMTAYALGELSAAEAAVFEAKLQESPNARRELASMREIMSLLGEGLRGEWQNEFERPTLKVFEPTEEVDSSVIIAGEFRPIRRSFAAAAAVAALLLAGAAVVTSQKSGLFDPVSPSLVSSAKGVSESGLTAAVSEAGAHVPQLFLAEEVGDLSSLDLVDGTEATDPGIDASYLESDSVIPASFQPGETVSRSFPTERAQTLDRVDSYLPPFGGFSSGRGPTTGMIERRLGRGSDTLAQNRSASVLVSGYVTMGGGQSDSQPRILAGFRPVSISGNPVVNEESDLRLLADLNGLQKELSEVIEEMPQGAEERADLERILERSRRVVTQLKMEMTR